MNKLALLLLLLFFSTPMQAEADQDRYQLYCFYTPQFKNMYEEYFLKSIQDDFEVIVREYPQECPSGTFQSNGWDQTMLRKLELLLEAIDENWNDQVFFYSDIDIIFLKPILQISLDLLSDRDFVVQQGFPRNGLCAGFFVMRGNEKTKKLISTAHHLLSMKLFKDDQDALQAVLNGPMLGEIDWEFLPSEQFPNGKRVLKNPRYLYSVGSLLMLPPSMILFHANCCIGLETKYHFLNHVQSEFSKINPVNRESL